MATTKGTRIEFVVGDPDGPLDSPLGRDLRRLEEKIRTGDRAGIEARWEFGRRLLERRGDTKQLPKGLMEAIVAQHGIGASEIRHRVRFAEKYPDKTEVSIMIETYRTWREIYTNALYEKRAAAAKPAKADNVIRLGFTVRRLSKELTVRRGDFTAAERQLLSHLLDLLGEMLDDEKKAAK